MLCALWHCISYLEMIGIRCLSCDNKNHYSCPSSPFYHCFFCIFHSSWSLVAITKYPSSLLTSFLEQPYTALTPFLPDTHTYLTFSPFLPLLFPSLCQWLVIVILQAWDNHLRSHPPLNSPPLASLSSSLSPTLLPSRLTSYSYPLSLPPT